MGSRAAAAMMGAAPTLMRKAGIVGSIVLPLAGLAAYVFWQMKTPSDPDEPE